LDLFIQRKSKHEKRHTRYAIEEGKGTKTDRRKERKRVSLLKWMFSIRLFWIYSNIEKRKKEEIVLV